MAIRKQGKWYYIDITNKNLPNGRLRFSTRPATKAQALRIHQDIEAKILEMDFNVDMYLPIQDYTLEEVRVAYFKERTMYLRPKSVVDYGHAILSFQRYLDQCGKSLQPVRYIKKSDVKDFMNWCITDNGPNRPMAKISCNSKVSVLHLVMNWAMEEMKACKSNPFHEVELFDVPDEFRRDVTTEELIRILKICKNRDYRDCMLFMHLSGVRRGEAGGLEWADIDFVQKFFVVRGKKAKSKKYRALPLSNVLLDILNNRRHLPKPFNFNVDQLTKQFKRYVDRLEIEGVTLHSLRHGTSTRMFEMGEHPLKIMNVLGHADLKQTLRYTHMRPEYMRSSAELMDVVGGEVIAGAGITDVSGEPPDA